MNILKNKSKILSLVVLMMFAFSTISLAASPIVYVGTVGFEVNKISNDDNYKNEFQKYFANNLGKGAIVDAGYDVVYDLNEKSNNPNTPVTELPKKEVPTDAIVWDGTGTPGETGELKVVEVSAITKEVFKDVEKQLEFAINGETKAADLEAVKKAGYTVEFLTSIDSNPNPDGKVTPKSDFSYKVVVKKDGEVVAESEEVSVKVLEAENPAKITKHNIMMGDVEVKTLVVGDKGLKINIQEYETLAGKSVEVSPSGIEYKSSNVAVVAVNKATGALVPVSEGTATISITKDGMETYKIPVTVKAEARKATKATAENVNLSSTDNKASVKVTLVDQYGDPVKGAKLTVPKVENLVDDSIVTTDKTDKEGKTTVNVEATEKLATGVYTVNIKAEDVVVGSFTVNFAKADTENIVAYEFRTESEDNVIDFAANEEGKKDNELTLEVIGKDKDGIVAEVGTIKDAKDNYTVNLGGKSFTVEVKGDAVEKPKVEKGKLVFKATAKPGKVTVTLKEGALTRASYEIIVVNNTKPAITEAKVNGTIVEFEDNKATVGYTLGNPIGDGSVIFNQEVIVKSIEVGGVEIGPEYLGDLLLKADHDFRVIYSDKIEIAKIGTKIDDLVEIAKEFKVTVENKSGLTETFTIKLVAEDTVAE